MAFSNQTFQADLSGLRRRFVFGEPAAVRPSIFDVLLERISARPAQHSEVAEISLSSIAELLLDPGRSGLNFKSVEGKADPSAPVAAEVPWSPESAVLFLETLGSVELAPIQDTLEATLELARALTLALQELQQQSGHVTSLLDREDVRIASIREAKTLQTPAGMAQERQARDMSRKSGESGPRDLRILLDGFDRTARALMHGATQVDSRAAQLQQCLLVGSAASAARALGAPFLAERVRDLRVANALDELRRAVETIEKRLSSSWSTFGNRS
jgi:hypothetical protein